MTPREELEKLRRLKELEEKAAKTDFREQSLANATKRVPEMPSPLARLGRGIMDVYQGGRQLLPENLGGYTPEQKAEINDNIARYEQGMDAWQDGIDGMRVAGQAIGTSPLMALPGGQTTFLGRLGMGAAAGGAGAGLLYEENLQDKATNALIGAGIGGVAGAALPLMAQGAGKGYSITKEAIKRGSNIFKNLDPKLTVTVSSQIDDALMKAGIPLNRVGEAAKKRLVAEAQESLRTTGSLDADALVRSLRSKAFGFTDDAAMTTGQMTRDPKLWGKEFNLSKGEDEAGEMLANRFDNQRNVVSGFFQKLQKEVFGDNADSLTPYTVLNQTKSAVKSKSDALQQQVREAYENIPGNPTLSKEALANRTSQIISDFEDIIPKGVANKINKLSNSDDIAFTFDEYVKLDKLISKTTGDTPSSAAAGSELKKALQGVLDDSGQNLTGDAKAAYTYAKSLAKKRFDAIGPDNRLLGMINNDKVSDQQILNKIKTGSSVDEIKKLFDFVDDESAKQIRTLVLNDIIDSSMPSGNFSQAAFNRAIKKMAKEKRDIIFGGNSRKLEDFARVVEDMFSAPAGNTANFSGSGIEVGNLVRRLYNGLIDFSGPETRILSGLINKGTNPSIQNKAIAELSLSGTTNLPPLMSARNVVTPEMMSRLPALGVPAGLLAAEKIR